MLPDEYGKEEKEVLKLIFMVVRVHFAYELNRTDWTTKLGRI